MRTEIIEIGDSLGFVLPEGVLERLGVKTGDELYLVAREGGLSLERKAPDIPRGDCCS